MSHSARIVCDSVTQYGHRLTTMEVVMPRIILAEFNTHRVFSRNSASSRAIPVEKMLRMVEENPYVPSSWGKNQKGMQAEQDVFVLDGMEARIVWLHARDQAMNRVKKLLALGIHKQTTNRLLEPFMWHTVIVTATEWSNFFHLRTHKAAHPDMQLVASAMESAYDESIPLLVHTGSWHLPYMTLADRAEYPSDILIKGSIGKCARVSYLTHDGVRDIYKDVELYSSLLSNGHMSPLEHVATPLEGWSGNFFGWQQYRKLIKNEKDMLG